MAPPMLDAQVCAEIVRQHARTFHFASRFLPLEKRRAAFAVYAFCREADDLVDSAGPRATTDVARALQGRVVNLREALDGRPTDALHRELLWAIDRFDIPQEPFLELLCALTADLRPVIYGDWESLQAYCAGVASTVGVMCAHIFGVPSAPAARAWTLAHAQHLGLAMQLTNILRDIGEDASRGRCYLPTDDLDAFAIDRGEILTHAIKPSDSRWRALMRFEVSRARTLFAWAAPGVSKLDADSQTCARLCSTGYAAILDVLERSGYDSLRRRSRVSLARKLGLAVAAWRPVHET